MRLALTSKKMKKKINENPFIENKILRYNWDITNKQIEEIKKNPMSLFIGMKSKKIEKDSLVNKYSYDEQFEIMLKNEFFF